MSNAPAASVLCIGSELTRGEIHNGNATWLCDRLTALGAEVTCVESVADDPAAIAAAVTRLAAESRLLVATGGLGPTTDDLTSASVARALGVPLRRDPDVLEGLRARLEKRGRQLTASNQSQADFPEGAAILENPHGTAPGFGVSLSGCECFFMPGVPREMKPMFERFAAEALRRAVTDGHFQAKLRVFGLPESTINDSLEGLAEAHGVIVSYRAHFPEVEVKLTRRDIDRESAERVAGEAARDARARLGDAVYADGNAQLPELVSELLRERGLWLSAAESCTGGLLSSLVCAHPASDVFLGSVVSYDNRIKRELLGVSARTLDELGAVSAEVAEQMARGVRERLKSDVSVALTGIAGPTGGSADKPLGLVYYAASSPLGTLSERVVIDGRPRQQVQLQAAWRALNLLRLQLLGPWRELRGDGRL